MKIIKYSFPLIFLLLFCISVNADVFSLGPSGGGKPWGADILGGTKLWTEKMKINGVETGMRLTLINKKLKECFLILKNQFPKAVFRANNESILIEIKREKGILERIYLVDIGGVYPVIQFSIEIPENINRNPEWPEDFPLPPASSSRKVIELTDRGTLYASFVSSLSSRRVLNDAHATMISNGWSSAGKGVYLKEKPLRIVVVTATEDKNGKTHGSIIKRKLQTK